MMRIFCYFSEFSTFTGAFYTGAITICSLKVEYEKLQQEKTELQRAYVMVCVFSQLFLNESSKIWNTNFY